MNKHNLQRLNNRELILIETDHCDWEVKVNLMKDTVYYMHSWQSEEFIIRNRVLPAKSVIASATHVAALVIRMEGKIGSITPGAYADMIAVECNPLNELSLLTNQGKHMPLIMRSGVVFKNTLN